MDDAKITEDLIAERKRVNDWLMDERSMKFGSIGDIPFEAKTGVGRGRTREIRKGTASPNLDVLYLWTRACGRTLGDLFSGRDSFISPKNVRLHHKLEHLVETFGNEHWIVKALETAFNEQGPKTHGNVGRKREPVPQNVAIPKKSRPA